MAPRLPVLCALRPLALPYELTQPASFAWLAEAHTQAESLVAGASFDREKFRHRIGRALDRFGCGAHAIARRAHAHPDGRHTRWSEMLLYRLDQRPQGATTAARTAAFATAAEQLFDHAYPDGEERPPDELIHVTCTGYLSPSAAQLLVTNRGWGDATRVTHAYHMGCYAALPSVRLGAGLLGLGGARGRRVDLVHTELCTLQLDPSRHGPGDLVVQTLFADGAIRYTLRDEGPGLRILALDQATLPGSAQSMTWRTGDHGLEMSLARDVPERIGAALEPFVARLFEQAGLDLARERETALFAVHPGGPRIIDHVADTLRLAPHQVAHSRAVLLDHGNMSSATLPHVWARLADDAPDGALVASVAFGPGLTFAGGLFRVER